MNPDAERTARGLARPAGPRDCWSVSDLNRAVAGTLEQAFPLVQVAGEVSNFVRAASGHWYFSLKDDAAQVRCAMFRGRSQYVDFTPREGDAIEVRAQVRLYEARGEFQLVVDAMRRAGRGGLLEAFNRLKEMLAREGLFDLERKRALPVFVRTVGIITSPDAAALRDVATTLAARAPHVRAIVYPTPVQGEGAAQKIAQAIALANERRVIDGLDALIVCRGGGSIEDLWAFNEEIVARAIAESALPVVSGVGHETDVTIADFVADLRAPTPTAAAQMISRATEEWLTQIDGLRAHLVRAAARRWEQSALRLDAAAGRLVSPTQRLDAMQARTYALAWRLRAAMTRTLDAGDSRLAALRARRRKPDLLPLAQRIAEGEARLAAARVAHWNALRARLVALHGVLEAVSPQATLKRGYAIVEQQGQVVGSIGQVAVGTGIAVRLHDGTLGARVETVEQARGPRADKPQ